MGEFLGDMKLICKRTLVFALPFALTLSGGTSSAVETSELLDMSLEQLIKLEVTSVGKKPQRQSQSPAAIFVVRQEDIRRSGATSLPDILRMVPGLEVARIDSNKWAVSARGFNGRFANKLLVLIDGRTVYSPSFSGVYWDMQDVMLEDVERIEVIRGPGATLWGANAVNGVINIMTKEAGDTQGGLLSLGGGSIEQGFGAVRYGGKLGEGTYGRVYGKGFNRASFTTIEGTDSGDQWNRGQAGFRVDRKSEDGGGATLQGDAYAGDIDQRISQPGLDPARMVYGQDYGRMSGFNLLGRWRKPLAPDSEITVQAYYDHAYRSESYVVQERDMYDLELQHRFVPAEGHDVVWGLGYRLNHDRFSNQFPVYFCSPSQDRQLFSAFVQDEVALAGRELKLTLGSKFEHNEFTGFEGQPNIRLAWTPNDRHTLWGAVSRAVRIPTRAENDGRITILVEPGVPETFGLPIVVRTLGNHHMQAEVLMAYELGYRFLPDPSFTADLALFYNNYDRIRSTTTRVAPNFAKGVIENDEVFANQYGGESYGAELALDWKPMDFWQVQLGYTFLKLDLRGSDPYGPPAIAQSSPQQQLTLRSGVALPRDVSLDLWFRYVDRITAGFPDLRMAQPVDAYATLDARLAWKPWKEVGLALVGQNLLENRHVEFIQEGFGPKPTQIPRSVYLQLDWRF